MTSRVHKNGLGLSSRICKVGKIAYTSIPPCPDTSRSPQGIASLAAPIAPATHPGACAPGPRGTELGRRFWERPPLRSTVGVSLPCVVQGPWHKGPRLPRPGKPVLSVSLSFPSGLATDVTPEPRPLRSGSHLHVQREARPSRPDPCPRSLYCPTRVAPREYARDLLSSPAVNTTTHSPGVSGERRSQPNWKPVYEAAPCKPLHRPHRPPHAGDPGPAGAGGSSASG